MTGSAVPRRMLGRELKKLRERSGVSVTVAAEAIEVSPQTLWRIESGQQGPKLKELYVKVLCGIYSAPEDLTDALVGLVAETKKPGWWHSFADAVLADTDMFIGLEESASRLTTFQLALIPGLLQTAEYRRAVHWIEFPTRSSREIEPLIELHSRRVASLTGGRRSTRLEALVCESALRRGIGGPSVMEEQLIYLADAGVAANISIRIVPHEATGNLGLITGSFVLMEFPVRSNSRLSEPPVVYVQGYTGALYLDQEAEIKQYRQAVAQIQRVALDEEKSRNLLLDVAREYQA
jgi:DNA-binding XRE family transcriptional regulator